MTSTQCIALLIQQQQRLIERRDHKVKLHPTLSPYGDEILENTLSIRSLDFAIMKLGDVIIDIHNQERLEQVHAEQKAISA